MQRADRHGMHGQTPCCIALHCEFNCTACVCIVMAHIMPYVCMHMTNLQGIQQGFSDPQPKSSNCRQSPGKAEQLISCMQPWLHAGSADLGAFRTATQIKHLCSPSVNDTVFASEACLWSHLHGPATQDSTSMKELIQTAWQELQRNKRQGTWNAKRLDLL